MLNCLSLNQTITKCKNDNTLYFENSTHNDTASKFTNLLIKQQFHNSLVLIK